MVLIVKKLVPVYKSTNSVPKKYLNLRKGAYVTTFKYAYTNIKEILIREYGLKPEDRIIIYYTRNVPRRNFPGYRLPFSKVYSGLLTKLRIDKWRIL